MTSHRHQRDSPTTTSARQSKPNLESGVTNGGATKLLNSSFSLTATTWSSSMPHSRQSMVPSLQALHLLRIQMDQPSYMTRPKYLRDGLTILTTYWTGNQLSAVKPLKNSLSVQLFKLSLENLMLLRPWNPWKCCQTAKHLVLMPFQLKFTRMVEITSYIAWRSSSNKCGTKNRSPKNTKFPQLFVCTRGRGIDTSVTTIGVLLC